MGGGKWSLHDQYQAAFDLCGSFAKNGVEVFRAKKRLYHKDNFSSDFVMLSKGLLRRG